MSAFHEEIPGYIFQRACAADAENIIALETASFPADEAASPEGVRMRLEHAVDYFVTMRSNEKDLIGFVNGTCCSKSFIEEESMSMHDPTGRTLVVHSVTIAAEHRRKGLGCAMLKAYMRHVARLGSVDLVLLLCKAYLLQFYIDCGFNLVRQSPVEHGKVIK